MIWFCNNPQTDFLSFHEKNILCFALQSLWEISSRNICCMSLVLLDPCRTKRYNVGRTTSQLEVSVNLGRCRDRRKSRKTRSSFTRRFLVERKRCGRLCRRFYYCNGCVGTTVDAIIASLQARLFSFMAEFRYVRYGEFWKRHRDVQSINLDR